MKTYEKPKLIALSISGNDLLCGCSYMDATIEELIKWAGFDFAESEGCETPWPDDDNTEKYCKFTSVNNYLMTS